MDKRKVSTDLEGKNIKEIRALKDRSQANYIRQLQYQGKLTEYITKSGYIGYDKDELKEYKYTVHRGRPLKIRREV